MNEDSNLPVSYWSPHEKQGVPPDDNEDDAIGAVRGLVNAMAITAACVAIALFLASLFTNPAHARRDGRPGPGPVSWGSK